MTTRHRLLVEPLEDRSLPSTVGVPWMDPQRLRLSFAPDHTPITAHESNLFTALAHLWPAFWQREILWAFQSWAVHSNINFRLTPDDGLPFGNSGLLQGDPRFGDIRIGAQRMGPEVLAVSVPHDPFISGTLAGDVFLNSAHQFSAADLFPILLHEAGHVLGLGHSDDPLSPMFSHLNHITALTAGDIAAIQALYGVRQPDRHEGPYGNDTFDTASPVRYPYGGGDYEGATPLVLFGDITTDQDVDFFAVRAVPGYYGPMTFRVQTEGLSLLSPRMTVFDAEGRMLASAESSNPSDVLIAQVGQVTPGATYYVKVQSRVTNVFHVGAYGLGITFDHNDVTEPGRLEELLLGPHETLSPDDLANLALDERALLGYDRHGNDTFATATRLSTSEVPGGFARTEVVACLSDLTDVDVYSFRTPRLTPSGARSVVLTASVREFPSGGAPAVLELFQQDETRQLAEILVNGNGTYTLQVPAALADREYFVRVRRPAGVAAVGNYSLTLHFGHVRADLESFAESDLPPGQSAEAYTLYVAQSQLFQFVFAEQQRRHTPVRMHMSIRDHCGAEVFGFSARGGETVTADGVFLRPGEYTVYFWNETTDQVSQLGARSQLRGRTITDPIGPALDDPTLTPLFSTGVPGEYQYPGDILSHSPFLWVFLGGV